MNKLILSALALIAFASCNKESGDNNTIDPTTPVAAQFTSTPLTRVANDVWEADDQIGIYMVAKDALLTDANATALNNGTNVLHTVAEAGATGTFKSADADKIYFPMDGSAVDFHAYYPHQIGITDGVYKINVAEQTIFTNIDLLASKVANKSKLSPQVKFDFAHQLSMITMNITASAEITESMEGLKVTIEGLPTTADFNLADKSFTTLGTTQNIISTTKADGSVSQAILIPSEAIANARICFELSTTEKIYWNISDKIFAGGENVSYGIKILRPEEGPIAIVVSGSEITPWKDVVGNGISAE